MYTIVTMFGQAFELGVKLPIETVLRRGQMEFTRTTRKGKEMQTVVEVGPYKGLFGTMHSIIYEEGERVFGRIGEGYDRFAGYEARESGPGQKKEKRAGL